MALAYIDQRCVPYHLANRNRLTKIMGIIGWSDERFCTGWHYDEYQNSIGLENCIPGLLITEAQFSLLGYDTVCLHNTDGSIVTYYYYMDVFQEHYMKSSCTTAFGALD